jgi:hypothetical protein
MPTPPFSKRPNADFITSHLKRKINTSCMRSIRLRTPIATANLRMIFRVLNKQKMTPIKSIKAVGLSSWSTSCTKIPKRISNPRKMSS